jgi:ubiquinone/menaquinone biosynthesis C-methylase UbiE
VRFVKALAYPQGLKAHWQRSTRLQPEIHVLDAGCGTGISALALREAMTDRGLVPAKIKCFDITPNMQRTFKEKLEQESISGIEVIQADVLELKNLSPDWSDFRLVGFSKITFRNFPFPYNHLSLWGHIVEAE